MRKLILYLFSFLIIGSLNSQDKNEFYIITKLGNNLWNEMNVGLGFVLRSEKNIELLFGYERKSGLLDFDCFLGVSMPNYFRTRTNIKGYNLRTTYYSNFTSRIGLTNILRIGVANDQLKDHCLPPSESIYELYDEKLFDIGLMLPIRLQNSRLAHFIVSPGFLIRTSKISNYRKTGNFGLIELRNDRMTTRFKILFEWGVQLNLGKCTFKSKH